MSGTSRSSQRSTRRFGETTKRLNRYDGTRRHAKPSSDTALCMCFHIAAVPYLFYNRVTMSRRLFPLFVILLVGLPFGAPALAASVFAQDVRVSGHVRDAATGAALA